MFSKQTWRPFLAHQVKIFELFVRYRILISPMGRLKKASFSRDFCLHWLLWTNRNVVVRLMSPRRHNDVESRMFYVNFIMIRQRRIFRKQRGIHGKETKLGVGYGYKITSLDIFLAPLGKAQ